MSDKEIKLTDDDINKLIKSPFDKKIHITKQIAEYYKNGGFDEGQMVAAAQIFGTLVKDTEVKIRKNLSEAIKDVPDLPHDMVLSLANDVNEVSLPVLQFSDVLTDTDLIEIVNSTEDVNKQKSISQREIVSESVSHALVDTHNEEVVDTLLHNEGAEVSEDDFEQIVEDFGDKEEIMDSIISRESLPVTVIENLANKISDTIHEKLMERNPEAFARMDEAIKKSRDVSTLQVMGLRSTESEYYNFCKLMEQLRISDDLAPIYALCMGNLNIFEVKVARITQTPVLNIRKLLEDTTNKGFHKAYNRAELPPDLEDAAEVLITALRELTKENADHIKEETFTTEMSRQLTPRIMKNVPNVESVKNLDYILSLVSHYASTDSLNPNTEPPTSTL